jgi:hypothetical protein
MAESTGRQLRYNRLLDRRQALMKEGQVFSGYNDT